MSVPWGSNKLERHVFDGSGTPGTVRAATAGARFAVVRLTATSEDGGEVIVHHGSNIAAQQLVNMYAGANGGVAWQYERDTAPVVPAGDDLLVSNAAGLVKVQVEGFTYSNTPQS